jgi:hypothetical protein
MLRQLEQEKIIERLFCKRYNATCQLLIDLGPICSFNTSCGTTDSHFSSRGTNLHVNDKLWDLQCI